MTWEPKPGTGWRRGKTPSGLASFGLMLEPENEAGACLFVTLHEDDLFEIARSPRSFVYEIPTMGDIQRVELDFAVPAWRVKGFTEAKGERRALVLQAVRKP